MLGRENAVIFGIPKIFEYIYQKHKNDKLMADQPWYPDRVHKWNRIAEEYEQGKVPPPQYYLFKEYWDAKNASKK